MSNGSGGITFDIYRKLTSTANYIPIVSCYSWSQNISVIRGMLDRVLNVPLSLEKCKNEKALIINVATHRGSSSKKKNLKMIQTQKKKRKRAYYIYIYTYMFYLEYIIVRHSHQSQSHVLSLTSAKEALGWGKPSRLRNSQWPISYFKMQAL